MNQWFIRIDHVAAKPAGTSRNQEDASSENAPTFRALALDAIDQVAWIPDWGKARIQAAVKGRPDWCISRQRSWGVPIPAFYDAQGEPILDANIVRRAAALIETHGSNIWFEKSLPELWTEVKPADWRGPEPATKSLDTLDVWIDSGSSSRSVLMRRKELRHGAAKTAPSAGHTSQLSPDWQADMYLEGSDQHRGWFQSSLLLSLSGNGPAPFKTVLTHGFMVDADREKISKSKQGQGGYEKPQTSEAYIKKYGADVVRLWVASQDFRNDIIVSDERINKVSETYRVIRNSLRYQLSNLYDFDFTKHSVPDEKLTGLDRWILSEFSKLESDIAGAYDRSEFHVVYQLISQFLAVELSAIYHDVVKDRLYTDPANSPRRRSTQTALHRMLSSLCRMLAPILAFTSDEAWEFVPGRTIDVAHRLTWEPGSFRAPELEQNAWKSLFRLREQALTVLEQARKAKTIGKALEAKLAFSGPAADVQDAMCRREALRELLNVSALSLEVSDAPSLSIELAKADGQKCERCWHWETDVGSVREHPTICRRCVEAIQTFAAQPPGPSTS
jgi:isoleucyl-tRNA synthetase